MANRKRKIVLRVPVTPEERAMIEQKMALLHTKNFSAYARKMLIDGYRGFLCGLIWKTISRPSSRQAMRGGRSSTT